MSGKQAKALKRFPRFETADLSEYDFTGFWPTRFEPKAEVNR
jgi:hypothetical protein